MQLNTLQLFIRSLIEPVVAAGAPPDSIDDLRRTCDLLASFGGMSVGQFAVVLQQAREYQVTKQHAFPAYIEPVITSFERLRSLKGRAGSPEVNREDLVRELQALPLDSLDQKDLAQLSADLGWEVKPKAKKNDIIDGIWRSLTGDGKPKTATRRTRTAKPKATVPIEEYAQKINDLKERANAPDATREELEVRLKELNLKNLSKDDLVALARQLSRDVNSKTKKDAAIDAVERVVLEVKEMQLAGTH